MTSYVPHIEEIEEERDNHLNDSVLVFLLNTIYDELLVQHML